jgi:hypothetical protein
LQLSVNFARAAILVRNEAEAAAIDTAPTLKPEARALLDKHIRSARAEWAAHERRSAGESKKTP